MISRPAQYLLRFDDLCPTFSVQRWERFLPLIEEFGIRPILAIVPDNRDPELMMSDPDANFWMKMRALERVGATIGLHGWRHLCRSHGRTLIGVSRRTEFAGIEEETQRTWIEKGMTALRNEGMNPRIWVAPRHGTDAATLRVLKGAGLEYVSDGLARMPFVRGGVTWIPQQLWAPEQRKSGLWTICIHSNTASDEEADQLLEFARLHASQFTCVERVVEEYRPASLNLYERCDAAIRASRVALRACGKDLFDTMQRYA
ncbi:MAG TPA: DUF2334 domain-containing protein [Terracidiphilus sp.]|nr:DUF2334 domain-containing protein [Terracidiphilus sp.]